MKVLWGNLLRLIYRDGKVYRRMPENEMNQMKFGCRATCKGMGGDATLGEQICQGLGRSRR